MTTSSGVLMPESVGDVCTEITFPTETVTPMRRIVSQFL